MKKILFAVLTVGVMSTSAIAGAFVGTIEKTSADLTGNMAIYLTHSDGVKSGVLLGADDSARKAMIAMIITAKTSNSIVRMIFDQVNGAYGWTSIELQ